MRISGIAILALGAASLAPAKKPHFELVWTRGFGDPSYVCQPATAVVDSHGDLWAICDGFDYAQQQDVTTLYHIGGGGDLKGAQELNARVAATRPWRVTGQQLVAGGDKLGLLVNTQAARMDPDFQGAFFAPVDPTGTPGELSRVLGPDSRFDDAAVGRDGTILVAGVNPLTLVAVAPTGQVLWRRPLESDLVLPSVAVFEDGSSCLSAVRPGAGNAPPAAHVFRLDATGQVTRQVSIPASRGVVTAGPGGVCAVLFSRAGRRHRGLFLAGFDASLRRLWTTHTPLAGGLGTPCQLAGAAGGYLALGRERKAADRAILAKFNSSGKRLWSDSPLPYGAEALAAWGPDAVYLLSWGGPQTPGVKAASFRVMKIRIR